MASHQTLQPDRKDELLATLADERRRTILTYLRESSSGVATVETLTADTDLEHPGGDEANAIALVHADLPRLEDAGLVEFDHRSMTVKYLSVREAEQLLDCIEGVWSR